MRHFGVMKTRFVTVLLVYFSGVLFGVSVSRVQMTRFVGGRLGPLVFLQIRNNSDRCCKAQEHLICKWKLSLEWLFSRNHVA